DAELTRGRADAQLGGRADRDRVLGDLCEHLLRARVPPFRERLRPPRRRVHGHERLGEDDELRAVAGSLAGELLEPVECRLAIEDHGLGLNAGDFHGVLHPAKSTLAAWARCTKRSTRSSPPGSSTCSSLAPLRSPRTATSTCRRRATCAGSGSSGRARSGTSTS